MAGEARVMLKTIYIVWCFRPKMHTPQPIGKKLGKPIRAYSTTQLAAILLRVLWDINQPKNNPSFVGIKQVFLIPITMKIKPLLSQDYPSQDN